MKNCSINFPYIGANFLVISMTKHSYKNKLKRRTCGSACSLNYCVFLIIRLSVIFEDDFNISPSLTISPS